MPSPRQTLSFLMGRFQEAGIRPDTRHGQNFLIDLNLIDVLIAAARPGPRDVMLEVGTGLGSLTTRLAESAAAVVTVEIDHRLHAMAAEELDEYNNVTMLLQDALKGKNRLHPVVLEAVQVQLAKEPERRFKLAANLPYNVATPILSNLLTSDPSPVSMTATIQKELADRIVASPRTKDYSALSIWMQSLADIDIVRILPPQVFWPKPKVNSAIIHIIPNAEKRAKIPDLTFFHQFIRTLFQHRRKFLRSVLVHVLADKLSKSEVDETLAPFDFATDTRAEQLDIETLQALSEAFRLRIGQGK